MSKPCTWLTSRMRSRGTSMKRATASHSPSSSRSWRSPTVKRCGACRWSSSQITARPQGVCVQRKPPIGLGSVMNIVGIGIDATDLPRIAQTLQRYGDRFLRRVFTEREIAYCTRRRDPVPHLAGRFAAKEAAMKALGTGHSRGVLWKDIEVVRAPGEAPQLRFHGGAARRFAYLKANSSVLTITHSQTLAIAQVMLLL